MNRKLSRRDLLILASQLGISLYAANYFFSDFEVFAVGGPKTLGSKTLSISSGTSPSEITKAAIAKLGGIKRFVKSGDIVVLKPNIGWDVPPGYGANTSPEIVGTMAKLCKEAGAKKIKIIDNPCVDCQIAYTKSGLIKVAKAVGADIHYLDDRTLKKIDMKGNYIKKWPVYTEFIEADKLINIPIAKHHGITKLSLGMKNWLGCIGGDRGELHLSIDEAVVDLARFFKPDLTVVDLVKVLIRNGPRGGNIKDVKTFNSVIAGTDVVAADAYSATFFGLKSTDVGYIKLGHNYGLGEIDYKKFLNA